MEEIRKKRIIRRIISHSEVFDPQYLNKKNVEELKSLQRDCLIELKIRMKYHLRHTQRN